MSNTSETPTGSGYLNPFVEKLGVFLSRNCEFESHIEFHRCENNNEM